MHTWLGGWTLEVSIIFFCKHFAVLFLLKIYEQLSLICKKRLFNARFSMSRKREHYQKRKVPNCVKQFNRWKCIFFWTFVLDFCVYSLPLHSYEIFFFVERKKGFILCFRLCIYCNFWVLFVVTIILVVMMTGGFSRFIEKVANKLYGSFKVAFREGYNRKWHAEIFLRHLQSRFCQTCIFFHCNQHNSGWIDFLFRFYCWGIRF